MTFDVISPSSLGSLYSYNTVAVETGSYIPPVDVLGGDISSYIEFFALDVQDIFMFLVNDVVCNPIFMLVCGFVLICLGVNIIRHASIF